MAEAHEPRRLALDLTFQPGDYLCTWHVPDEADRLVDVPGRLSVSPNRAPEGEVYGDLPIHWELQPGVQSAAFPQSRRLESIRKSDLDKDLKKFIRKHLRKDPPTSLESVLAATIPSRVVKRLDETQLVAEVKRELSERTTAFEALRRVRNQLSHGNRGYDAYALAEVAQVLEQVVRRHALYELGCSATVADRVFQMM